MTAYRDTGTTTHVIEALDGGLAPLCDAAQQLPFTLKQFKAVDPDLIRFVEGDDGQPLSPWCPDCADVIRKRRDQWQRDVLDHMDAP